MSLFKKNIALLLLYFIKFRELFWGNFYIFFSISTKLPLNLTLFRSSGDETNYRDSFSLTVHEYSNLLASQEYSESGDETIWLCLIISLY